MILFCKLDSNKRIVAVSTSDFPQPGWEAVAFPDDFDIYGATNYKIVDGAIVYVEPAVEHPKPTTEDRLAALEGAMLALMGGAADV